MECRGEVTGEERKGVERSGKVEWRWNTSTVVELPDPGEKLQE